MSASFALRSTMVRNTNVTANLLRHHLVIVVLLAVFGFANVYLVNGLDEESPAPAVPAGAVEASANAVPPANLAPTVPAKKAAVPSVDLSPRMRAALDYVTRRYRVSQAALVPVFETAQVAGRQRHIDPLLIVAVIAIESRFNPFAESPVGAQGLMQIMPRYHMDKLPVNAGRNPFFDPVVNIKVGVKVLEEAIRRRGGLIEGLQYYAGSSDPEAGYAGKVLAVKERLERAAQRSESPSA